MSTEKNSVLDDLEALLREGNRLSGQRSYGRRQAAPEALPLLAKARSGLRSYTKNHPADSRAWRLLASAEEFLLAYPSAFAALERAIALSGKKTKADLKRLGLLQAAIEDSNKLGLSPDQVQNLGAYLREKLSVESTSTDDLVHTSTWLSESGFTDDRAARVLQSLRARGVYSDDQVIERIVESH